MTDEFKIGDTVCLKDNFVDNYKDEATGYIFLAPGQPADVQFGLGRDIPFTIISKSRRGDGSHWFYLTNFTDNWGAEDIICDGKKYKVHRMYENEIEKREELNTISLYELNRGL